MPTELFTKSLNYHPAAASDAGDAKALTSVTIDTDRCTRYACRLFQDVENGPSPEWLQKRLRQIGQRPISLLVDLTNYVMMEQGQPLHAFDMDKLAGGRIVVQQAADGDDFTTLDEVEHKLASTDMMICDAEQPVALAGVMGGLETEVSSSTKNCLLESAHFVNTSVRKTRTRLNLFTEASYRFERHVDPAGVVAALNRFAELYQEITGKSCVPGLVDEWPIKPQPLEVSVPMARCDDRLGMSIPSDQASEYLRRLGFQVIESGEQITVQVPSWRIDVVQEEDLIEEIGRVHGYELIPSIPPAGTTHAGGLQGLQRFTNRLHEEALRCGLDQMWSHTMRATHSLDSASEFVAVRTPHSPELANLRNSLLPCLADAVQKNERRNLHLYEYGKVFSTAGETSQLALFMTGDIEAAHWGVKESRKADFFIAKGVVERLLSAGHVSYEISADSSDPRFHPTRQAAVLVGGKHAGTIGELHPDIADELDLVDPAAIAELCLDTLWTAAADHTTPKPISRNPAISRDMAVVIEKSVPYADVEKAIAGAAGELLEKQWLFDVYEGKGIPEGSHSLAVAIQLRKLGSNFTDEEANQVRESVVLALESLGATLR
jgi:phenylalanyl-tRNA synthetase beta chain